MSTPSGVDPQGTPDATGQGSDAQTSTAHDFEVLPAVTRDETDAGWGERSSDDADLEHYLRERPPHHGD